MTLDDLFDLFVAFATGMKSYDLHTCRPWSYPAGTPLGQAWLLGWQHQRSLDPAVFGGGSTTRTEAIAAFFTSRPEVTIICVEAGHAYGRARYNSTCKLTRTPIQAGEAVRQVKLVCRADSARTHTLFMANSTYGMLFGCSRARIEHAPSGVGGYHFTDIEYSAWTRFQGVEQVAAVLDERPTIIEMVTRYGEKRTYKGANGRWNGGQSTKAMLASMRRGARNLRLVRVERKEDREFDELGTCSVRVWVPLT